MAWTDPRTWVTNEVVTSSLLNTHVRDNLKSVSHPYDYASSDVDVTSTTTETSLWSKTITGGDLGASGLLHLTLAGDYLKNNSSGDTCRLRVKFGGSTLLDDTLSFNGTTTGAGRQAWDLDVIIANRGATNSQFLRGAFVTMQTHEPAPGAGVGAWDGSYTPLHGVIVNTSTVDTTANQTFQVTAEWSAASANNSFRKRLAVLRLAQN